MELGDISLQRSRGTRTPERHTSIWGRSGAVLTAEIGGVRSADLLLTVKK
jgi:hypothetical protein